jgi:hypothetical protein
VEDEMTLAILGFTSLVVIMFLCVVIGKSIDKREEDSVGKDKIKGEKEEA